MKKKVIILGSTGSIGTKTFNIFKKDNNNFDVLLLSTYSNIDKIVKQAKELKVKNIIINNTEKYKEAKIKYAKQDFKIFNNFSDIKKIIGKKKIYYSMISVSGLDGLEPTLILSKYSKNLAIVNKESLICGWNLIKKKLIKFRTNFIPIDSEHYSIYTLMKNHSYDDVDKVYITASGGPFLNYPKKKFKFIKPNTALKHPNWKMGRKITIDSSTLMNKVFEVIEAKNLFNLSYQKISILTHPKSYIHAIIKFNNGITKILIHDPDMKIPIYNSIYKDKVKKIASKNLDIKILNNPSLKEVNLSKFPLVNILKNLPKKNSLFETILVTVNDYFVFKFLEKRIDYKKMIKLIFKILNSNEFVRYKKIQPKNMEDIYKLRDYVSLKLSRMSI
tara:strand:+ start:1537 stop:2703 length:1167 start_codon:yes stop_codon:yes gene_type:complete